jgi:hypothetical protein
MMVEPVKGGEGRGRGRERQENMSKIKGEYMRMSEAL